MSINAKLEFFLSFTFVLETLGILTLNRVPRNS